MTAPTPDADQAPCCDRCGLATVRIGKLAQIGRRPLVHVFKCKPCRQIMSIEEGPRNTAGAPKPAAGQPSSLALPQDQGSAIVGAPGL
jgi:hypothetical protein